MKTRIGIVGGGQLARMMAVPARQLGFHVTVLDPEPYSPAGQAVDDQIVASWDDEQAVTKLGRQADFVTVETELVHWEALNTLGNKVNPTPTTLEVLINKLKQKQLLQSLGVPTADFREVKSSQDLAQAGTELGYPLMLKVAVNAYDGKGNFLIKAAKGIDAAWSKLNGQIAYAEKFVPFSKELAVMVVRSLKGDIKVYPAVETIHVNHICHLVLAPAPVDPKVRLKAQQFATTVMKHLKGAGVFGFEMFLTQAGEVLINEIAPRVHNSGHYTIEACVTSQFEQHIRAITGLPLGSTDMKPSAAVMINILGDREGPAELGGLGEALELPGVAVHIYSKAQTRVGRKMGHITVVGETTDKCREIAEKARKYITI